ncbi:MAG: DUF447 family protein [Pseudomonadota bacterium]|nr:DUF447 family protein [Pseudomonadota bacterium]
MIRETVVTTRAEDGHIHIAPMGIREEGEHLLLAPFRPSQSLDNMLRERCAVINYTDDVRIIAGCLTGRWQWPLCPANSIVGARLKDTLAHTEVLVERVEDDELRPRLLCRPVHEEQHTPFRGFNRAQAAVLEAAILVSRLPMLPWQKIQSEIEYLSIAVEKTAGPQERQAWEWLMEAVTQYREKQGNEARV